MSGYNGYEFFRNERGQLTCERRQRPSAPIVPHDKEQWLRSVEAKLNADERAFLRSSVAKMTPSQLETVARFSADDAAELLRREMPRRTK